jgi:hypothetical protein
MTPVEQDTDSLQALEQRIQQAVQLVARLRQEKDAAVQEAAEARGSRPDLRRTENAARRAQTGAQPHREAVGADRPTERRLKRWPPAHPKNTRYASPS